ncbi:unnamed protein product, partial [Vitis vinifera]|uniref:Uncharacterized protein n=1 Tax=Vitis vinifera TaxID=29760 RepID=D7T462_VITVI
MKLEAASKSFRRQCKRWVENSVGYTRRNSGKTRHCEGN